MGDQTGLDAILLQIIFAILTSTYLWYITFPGLLFMRTALFWVTFRELKMATAVFSGGLALIEGVIASGFLIDYPNYGRYVFHIQCFAAVASPPIATFFILRWQRGQPISRWKRGLFWLLGSTIGLVGVGVSAIVLINLLSVLIGPTSG